MIVATVRTRNEARNIGRFCNAYQNIADAILVADGGSIDNTVNIALDFPRVRVRRFPEQFITKNDTILNPQGEHVNFLIDWAIDIGAEWIIFDDCDCVPNFVLRQNGRDLFKGTKNLALYTRRIYFWGFDKIFPEMHGAGDRAEETAEKEAEFGLPIWTSLWAWQPRADIRADEDDPWHLTMMSHDPGQAEQIRRSALHLDFPYCLLHFSWQTPKLAAAKIDNYRSSGQQPEAKSPLDWAGPMADPRWFMYEEPQDADM